MAYLRDGGSPTPGRSPRVLRLILPTILLFPLLAGCAGSEVNPGQLSIFATTGYLADAAARIAPDASVFTMVGPGGDPHTYQASTRDVQRLQEADLVLWTGLDLEAPLVDALETLGERQYAVGEHVSAELLLVWPETVGTAHEVIDPHIWNSPEAWTEVVEMIAERLAALDPDSADSYRQNAAVFQADIAAVAAEAATLLEAVPADRRVLITGHDAFNYFGQTFGFDVYATDFLSTEAALSPRELSGLADLIVEQQVPVIFQDSQANPQAITSLQEAVAARGWNVQVSERELYADSMGVEAPVNNYLGVFLHNAQTVAEGLGN